MDINICYVQLTKKGGYMYIRVLVGYINEAWSNNVQVDYIFEKISQQNVIVK